MNTTGSSHDIHPSDYTFSRTRQDRLYVPLEGRPGLPVPWWVVAAEIVTGAIWAAAFVWTVTVIL